MSLHHYFDKSHHCTLYWISCDNCGSTDGVGHEFSARTIREAEARRFRLGWVKDHTDEKYYCPACVEHLVELFRSTTVKCAVCGKTSYSPLTVLGRLGWRESDDGCIVCPDCIEDYKRMRKMKGMNGNE